MAYETVIGLEVHVELSTQTKIFCGCTTAFGGEPNSHTCPVCMGMPGSLPALNRAVVEKALEAGLALNCEITENSIFDRKNYFYPDLPKDYQISQLYYPICRNGSLAIETPRGRKDIRIHEIHMEEDAGKLVHEAGVSYVDYNRCGVPLIEIVSEPDLRSAEETAAYLETLREVLVYLGVSDCRMEEGSMRADVNVSVRKEGEETLGTRTETKNMNSVKAIQRAIAFESARQISLLESGGNVIQETRRWDDNTGENYAMRSKENAQDYRYFPDPDLVPVHIDEAWIAKVRNGLPETADAKRSRYASSWDIPANQAAIITADKPIADFFESALDSGLKLSGAATDKARARDVARETANVVTGDILRLMKEQEDEHRKDKEKILGCDPSKIASVINMVMGQTINRTVAKELIEKIYKDGTDPVSYIKENNLAMVRDEALLDDVAEKVLRENPDSVSDFLGGKEKAFGFLVGQAMKGLKGKASPQDVNKILREKLSAKSPGAFKDSSPNNDKFPSVDKTSAGSQIPAEGQPSDAGQDGLSPPIAPEAPEWKRKLDSIPFEKSGAASGATAVPGVPLHGISLRYRTLTCGDIAEGNIGQEVRLAGWIHTIRNHGGIVFLDLRDQYGVTQVVVTDEQVKNLRREMSISVLGKVLKRDEDTVNPLISTGRVELKAAEIEILGDCKSALPFEIENSKDTKEEIRLKYRFLDLRNPQVAGKLVLRSEIIKTIRASMEGMGFLEIQTPILANSSPEGARDYLVPSRKHKGKFYALPQAPQQFKQLLMVSGVDRYFQIAPCFRDEDARLDRSPGEFYQLDFEMAYATQDDVFAVAEKVISETFTKFTDKPVTKPPFIRIPYETAMLKYGSDKPDLRNPLEITDLTGFFSEVDFGPFRGNIVRGIVCPGAAAKPRSFFSSMEAFAKSIGMQGLGYISVKDDMTYKGPIDKFFTEKQRRDIAEICGLKPGDVLYFISDSPATVAGLAGQIRTEVAKRLDIIDKDRYEFCFITDYPMYEFNEEAGKIDFTHNPFSMPQGEMEALQNKDPLEILAWQYDIVCNGVELSSGAVRNHRPDIMVKAFEIAGYSEKDVEEKFGALFSAFQYGAPPHAGMAPGIDRIVMLLSGDENIREIIAFPLNSNAQNLMLQAPSEVTEQQLREVHIKIRQ